MAPELNDLHFAVVIGVNRYPEIRDLNSARNDATAFAEWLRKPDGGALPEDNIRLIFATDEEMPKGQILSRNNWRPKKDEILDALHEFRQRCVQRVKEKAENWQQSRLYIYVSGHGIAPAAREAALLLANAGPDWYGENFSCDRYMAFYENAQFFRELVVFADCCRQRVDNAPILDPPWTKVKGNNGKVITFLGFATYFGELAFEPDADEDEDPDDQRSYFTKALLEGLRGQAADEAGQIDSVSLARYVTARVEELTKHKKKKQTPQMPSDPAAPVVFRQDVPKQVAEEASTHAVMIDFVTQFAGKVVLRDGQHKPVEEHDPQAGTWTLELSNGLYRVSPVDPAIVNPFQDKGRFEVWGGPVHVQL
jgi:uncharacterized caspase-like protein